VTAFIHIRSFVFFTKLRAVICAYVLCQIGLCSAATFTWTGSVSTDWFNTNNWSPAGLPGDGDTVGFASGTINFTAPVTFGGQFNWSGGTLTGNALTIATNGVLTTSGGGGKSLWNALTNAGTVTMTGSSGLSVDYSSANNRFGFIENLPGALWDLQNDQSLQNTFNNGAYFRNAGTLRKSAGSGSSTISIPLLNTGTVSALSGTIVLNRGAVIEGAFNAVAGAVISFNAGSFTYAAPPAMTGPGTIRLNGGNLTLLSDAIANLQLLSGTASLAPNFQGGSITNLTMQGATLTGENVVSGTFNFAGTLPGSLTVLGGGTVNWSAGTALGPLMIASNGVLNISGNTTKIVRSSLTNAGTVTWLGNGNLQVDYSSADSYSGFIENLPGAFWEVQNNQSVVSTFNNGAYFRNAGTVRKSAATGSTTFAIPFFNSGSVIATTGTLNLNGDSVISGSFNAAAGAIISFNSGEFSYGTPPVVTGAGVVRLNGGNLALAADAIANLLIVGGNVTLAPGFQGGSITNLTMLGGVLEGDNTVSGTFNWSGTLPGSLTVLGGGRVNWSNGVATGPLTILSNGVLNISGNNVKFVRNALTNAGTVNWSETANLQVDYSTHNGYYGLIENLPGGVWDFQNNQNLFNNYSSGAYFRNAGTVRKSAGTGNSTISIPFFNSGNVTALTGTILVNKGAVIEGVFDAVAGAFISFNTGDFIYNTLPTVTGAGTVRVTGGTLTLASNIIPNLQLAGGTIGLGPGFQGGSITNLTLLGGTLTGNNAVSGTFNWAGTLSGGLTVLTGGVVNWSDGRIHGPLAIAPDGVLNISGDTTKFLWNALTNAGTVTWSGAADLRVDHSSNVTNYGSIYNLAGAVWDLRNNQNILNTFPTGAVFHNAGIVLKSASTGVSTISIPFFNTGTVDVDGGTVLFNKGALIEGSFDAAAGATISFNAGTFNYGALPTVTGAGTVQFTAGNLTLVQDIIPNLRLVGGVVSLGPDFQGGTITNLTMLGGTLAGNNIVSGTFDWAATLPGSLTILSGGTVNWTSGLIGGPVNIASGGVLNIAGSTTKLLVNALTNAGTVNWSGSGELQVNYSTTINNYGLIENLASGVWDIQNDSTLRNFYNFTAYFRNAGTVRKTGGIGTSTISIPFTNSGTVMSLQQTLAFTGGYAPAGGTMVAGLSSRSSYGRFNIAGNAALDGTLDVIWYGGFVGSISNTFNVLTYGSRTGAFSTVNLPPDAGWQVNYGATSLSVFVSSIRRLGITSPALGTTNAGAILAPVSAQVFDAATGTPVATNGLPVTIALATGNGILSGITTRNTDANGAVTFNDLSINLVGAKTLTASAPGLTAATNATFNIIPAAPAQLGLLAPIGETQRNHTAFSPSAVVQVRDQYGNAISNSTAPITARQSSGAGLLGGTTILNAGATTGSAAFTNLVYALANPQMAESVVVYFTSPGLLPVTNAPVWVNFVLGIITLVSGNSVVQIHAAGPESIFSWTVDGVEHIHQGGFWVRQGATGPQVSLDALGPPVGVSVSANAATVNYRTNSLNVTLGFTLAGGTVGSMASDLGQNLTIQNTSNGPVALSVFQYADFDLAQQAGGDTVAFPATNTVVQQGKGTVMTETAFPAPTYREASHYAITLERIVGAAPATLSNQLIPPTPGDQTFGYQWDATLASGQPLTLNLNNSLRPGSAGVAAAPVLLTIAPLNDSVVVSWPTAGTVGYYLERAAGFDAGTGWSPVTNSVTVTGEFYEVTMPAAEAVEYFRLKQ